MSIAPELKAKWVFGSQTLAEGGSVLGSTGGGAAINTFGISRALSWYVETDAGCTCSYQLRTGRNSTGPWTVLSSGTLGTLAVDYWNFDGPLQWVSPRIKTITSTAVNAIVELLGN